MNNDPTSLSLLKRVRTSADNDAWRQFNDCYGPLIRGWLLRRGINLIDAEDLGQEVMQVALQEVAAFEHNGRPGAFRAWLRQVVANRLRTFWRQRQRQEAVPPGTEYGALAEQLADPQSELSRLWDAEYYQALCAQLLSLVEREFEYRTLASFRGVVLERKMTAEVARELGITANAVRIAQSRVLRRLRELGAGMLDESELIVE